VRAERQAELDGAFDRALVHHRQRAGQRQVDGAGLRVRLGAEGGGGAAEDLAAVDSCACVSKPMMTS
jgi:hypothetical protein